MEFTKEISNKLNKLLVKNYDAEKGYNNAIENVNSDKLKIFFERRSNERGKFASELKKEILQYGEDPKDSGSFSGTMHRNWMSLKSTFSSNNEEAILEEAIRGEEASLEDYTDLIQEPNLPPSIDSLLLRQKSTIQSAINSEKAKLELVS